MNRGKVNTFIPIGLLALMAGLFIRLFTHGRYADGSAGFLIGMSLVFIIFGFVQQRKKKVY